MVVRKAVFLLRKKIQAIVKNEKGASIAQWLVLTFIVTACALLVVKGLKGPLRETHDSGMEIIQRLTGGGF